MSGEWDGLRAAAEAVELEADWYEPDAYIDTRNPQDVGFIAAASPDVVLGLLDRLQAAEEEVALLHKVRDMEWDADAPMPESNIPEWGTEDYRRHAVLFNDIAHAHLNANLRFSDRLRLQRTLWALGWRRDVQPEDVTENRPQEATGADLSASGAESDHGGRRDGEGLCHCGQPIVWHDYQQPFVPDPEPNKRKWWQR